MHRLQWRPFVCLAVTLWVLLASYFELHPADVRRPAHPPHRGNPFGAVHVSACTVYCAVPGQQDTLVQLRWLTQLVKLILHELPHVRPVVVFYCAAVEDLVQTAFRNVTASLQPLPPPWNLEFNWTQMNAFFLSDDLWDRLTGDKILFFQADAWICPGAEDRLVPFLQYDYVGAPWGRARTHACPLRVGNGGFSLRDRHVCRRALRDPRTPQLMADARKKQRPHEDAIWCQILDTVGARLPSPQIAAHFSVENDDYGVTHPVGAHDCTYKATVLKLEQGCPGIMRKMSAVRWQKRPFHWLVQCLSLPGWIMFDRLFGLWMDAPLPWRWGVAAACMVVGAALGWRGDPGCSRPTVPGDQNPPGTVPHASPPILTTWLPHPTGTPSPKPSPGKAR